MVAAPGALTLEMPFVDVFCETGAFSLEQSRRILQTAQSAGFSAQDPCRRVRQPGWRQRWPSSLGAVSADHLVKTSAEDIQALAQSNTVAVALPCTPFGLAERSTPLPARSWKPDGLLAHCHRPQPRHGLVREHAVCHCPGLPLPAPDPGPGDRRCHHQRRGGDRPRRADRLASSRANRPTC